MASELVRRLIEANETNGDSISKGSDIFYKAAERIDFLENEVEKWKQVAEDAAAANTKVEACEIVERALSA